MASIRSSQESRLVVEIGERAHRLVDQFIATHSTCPDRAWESVVELRELLDQLQSICPARAFRHDAMARLARMRKESANQEPDDAFKATTLMTASAIARYLGTDCSVIYKLAKSGEIPCSQFGATSFRFNREQIDRWRPHHDDLLPCRRRRD